LRPNAWPAFRTASGRAARWSMTTISGYGSWPP
jgi:hypothetical protein